MTYSLKNVVPWGRTFDEYVNMFGLSDNDLKKHILGCSDGPASFNAEFTRQNGRILSIDPLYAFSTKQIRQRIDEIYDEVMHQLGQNQDEFVWHMIPSVAALGRLRMKAMNRFLEDFEAGKQNCRYQTASLPSLPFPDKTFDLTLCSHFLLLYSAQFDYKFHLASIIELCRVATEIRIFPILELGSKPSRHLPKLLSDLKDAGKTVEIKTVNYEFQKGGNQMMIIK